ncbi:beta-N-acetylglucosaminidase domain-containing protein [Mycoplasma sp. 246B]
MNLKKKVKTLLAAAGSVGLIASISVGVSAGSPATSNNTTYEIYPGVQSITYQNSDFLISNDVNIVFEDGIDNATINRFKEVLKLKNLTYSQTRRVIPGKTNILVGIRNDSDNLVDNQVKSLGITFDTVLDSKIESYQLDTKSVKDSNYTTNYITLVAKNTEAAFDGATTLWHIFKQLDGSKIRDFEIKDWADVATRGVIQGYYGDGWSLDASKDYMKWGSYYKLNAYFYAPKDDLKTNTQWSTLNTEDELTKIKDLASTSAATKVSFIYTLNPFVGTDAFTKANYAEKFEKLKAKFKQVIDAGVRQVGLVADGPNKPFESTQSTNSTPNPAPAAQATDNGSEGDSSSGQATSGAVATPENNDSQTQQKKLLSDLVAWLKLEKQVYPDLKVTLPYLVNEYSGTGEEYFKDFPSEVQVIMGGGSERTVDDTFTNSYVNHTNSSESSKSYTLNSPILWVNWPYTETTQSKLILGGYKAFLKPNPDTTKFTGLFLNASPYEQASKIAMFGGANYGWKKWKTDDEINKVLSAAFKHSINNSEQDSPVSLAYKEVAKHLVNKGQVFSPEPDLDESANIQQPINTLVQKLNNDTVTATDVNPLIQPFQTILDSLNTLLTSKDIPQLLVEIKPWLQSFQQLTKGVSSLLQAVIEFKNNNKDEFVQLVQAAKDVIYDARNHYKVVLSGQLIQVEPAVQYIQPLADVLMNWADSKIDGYTLQPTTHTTTFITNMQYPSGSTNLQDAFKPFNTNQIIYQDSFDGTQSTLKNGDYIGAKFSEPTTLWGVHLRFWANNQDYFLTSILQYQLAGSSQWNNITSYTSPNNQNTNISYTDTDVYGKDFTFTPIDNVIAVKLVNHETGNGRKKWMRLLEFRPNPQNPQKYNNVTYNSNNTTLINKNSNTTYLADGNKNTESQFSNPQTNTGSNDDKISEGKTLGFSLNEQQVVTEIQLQQGWTTKTDVVSSITVEYKDPSDSYTSTQWKQFGSTTLNTNNNNSNILAISGYANAQDFRFKVNSTTNHWWRINDIAVYGPNYKAKPQLSISSTLTPDRSSGFNNALDSNPNTVAIIDHDASNKNIQANDYFDIEFTRPVQLSTLNIKQDPSGLVPNLIILPKINNQTPDTKKVELTSVSEDQQVSIPSAWGLVTGVRIKANKSINAPWRIRDISYTEIEQPTDKYLGSHPASNTNFLTKRNGDTFELFNKTTPQTATAVNLNKDESVGLDLGNVYTVDTINKDIGTSQDSALKTQYSTDGYIWTDMTSDTLASPTQMRYVRIKNTKTDESSSVISMQFKDLKAHIVEYKPYGSFVSGTLNADFGTLKNAFDGDYNSKVIFAKPPVKDDNLIFDLGREVTLKSLKLFADKYTKDYPRDLVVSVATTNSSSSSWTDVLTIGDSTADTDSNSRLGETTNATDDPNHPDVKYWASSNITPNTKARYIKFTIKANYPADRKLTFNQILVNDGEYVAADNDPRFTGTSYSETSQNTTPDKMLDADIHSYYEPKSDNGNIKWYVEKDYFNRRDLRIVSEGVPSNAEVYANIIDTSSTSADTTQTKLGTLFNNVVEFKVPRESNKAITSIEIKWTTNKPKIAEIVGFFKNQTTDTSKTDLDTIKTNPAEYDSWTDATKASYDKVKALATTAAATDELLTQQTVNEIKAMADSIKNSAVTKATNTSDLETKIKEPVTNTDNILYTPDSFAQYDVALLNIQNALKNKGNISTADVTNLSSAYDTAKNALVKSDLPYQQALLNVNNFGTLNKINYTNESYQALKAIVDQINTKLATDGLDPLGYRDLNNQYKTKFTELVASNRSKMLKAYNDYLENNTYAFTDRYQHRFSSLASALNDLVDSQHYTIANPNVTADQVNNALTNLKALTQKSIAERNRLIYYYEQLTQKQIENTNNLYTPDSYDNYLRVFNQIKNSQQDINRISEQDIKDAQARMELAQESLVISENQLDAAKTLANSLLANLDDKADFASKISSATKDDISNIIKQIRSNLAKQLADKRAKAYADASEAVAKIKDINTRNNLIKQLETAKEVSEFNTVTANANNAYDLEVQNQKAFDAAKAEVVDLNKQVTDTKKQEAFNFKINSITDINDFKAVKDAINKQLAQEKQDRDAQAEKEQKELDALDKQVQDMLAKLPTNNAQAQDLKTKYQNLTKTLQSLSDFKAELTKFENDLKTKNEQEQAQKDKAKQEENKKPTGKSSNSGAIIGAVVASLVVLSIVGIFVWWFMKKRKK